MKLLIVDDDPSIRASLHMMRVLDDSGGNISEAARRLGLHRQNLQRRLRKHAPPH